MLEFFNRNIKPLSDELSKTLSQNFYEQMGCNHPKNGWDVEYGDPLALDDPMTVVCTYCDEEIWDLLTDAEQNELFIKRDQMLRYQSKHAYEDYLDNRIKEEY